jgi:hypothetical protein
MPDEVFISYSHRDQEFVTKLASDLNRQISGRVWFDRSDLQAGQRWRDEIATGIRDCKAFVLVLSPDSVDSVEVHKEIDHAVQMKRTIIPILYRPVKSFGDLDELVNETQFIDLRAGSYADNFQKLVDGLLAAGVAAGIGEARPFVRTGVKTDWGAVFLKIPGWGFAWGVGWALFWLVLALLLWFVSRGNDDPMPIANLILAPFSGGLGGFAGGLLAGIFTMFALRRNAPSISWKHMSPGIRIWTFVGVASILISALVADLLWRGFTPEEYACEGLNIVECLGGTFVSSLAQAIGFMLLVIMVILLLIVAMWFLTGLFAGWLAVRHIRRLEPGIGRSGAFWTSLGWGLGGILGAGVALAILAALSSMLGIN